MTVLLVTGTGTGVGKTVVASGVVALALAAGRSVTYVKPAQTGVPGDVPDVDTVVRFTGLDGAAAHECARFAAPLSPEAAARHAGVRPVDLARVAVTVHALEAVHDLVVVEGAGGLLVRYDEDGATVADLAETVGAEALVVTGAGLGTLNGTALTLEALARRDIPLAGVVIGAWPIEPDLAATSNVPDIEAIAGAPLSGAFPAGSGACPPAAFPTVARLSLAARWGGTFEGL